MILLPSLLFEKKINISICFVIIPVIIAISRYSLLLLGTEYIISSTRSSWIIPIYNQIKCKSNAPNKNPRTPKAFFLIWQTDCLLACWYKMTAKNTIKVGSFFLFVLFCKMDRRLFVVDIYFPMCLNLNWMHLHKKPRQHIILFLIFKLPNEKKKKLFTLGAVFGCMLFALPVGSFPIWISLTMSWKKKPMNKVWKSVNICVFLVSPCVCSPSIARFRVCRVERVYFRCMQNQHNSTSVLNKDMLSSCVRILHHWALLLKCY